MRKMNALASTLLLLIHLTTPTTCGWMSRIVRRNEDEDCTPQIIAVKKTKVVPVAVPVKAEPTIKYPETMKNQVQYTSEEPQYPQAEGQYPPKYEKGEEEYEPNVSEAPVYNANDGHEDEEDEDEEDEGDDELVDSHYDSAVAGHVRGGTSYEVDTGGYKRRKDGKKSNRKKQKS